MLETEKLPISQELERILTSDVFSRSDRMSGLLRFLVAEAMAGRSETLKESVLAVEVFGRSPEFDPKSDPVVRNEVRRLRGKLLEYYSRHVEKSSCIIEVPKGTYVPVFRQVSAGAPKHSGFRYIVSAGILSAVVFLIWFTIPRRAAAFRVKPIATTPGVFWHPAISPNGKHIAYSQGATEVTPPRIYVGPIDEDQRRRLTSVNAGGEYSPAWSPKGDQVAFLRWEKDGKVSVVIAASEGGSERVVSQGATARPTIAGPQLSWSPDGAWLAAAIGGSIALLPVAGGESRRLQVSTFRPLNPRFSPDGRQLAVIGSTGGLGNGIYRLRLAPDYSPMGEPIRLTPEHMPVFGGFAWTSDGRSVIFVAGVPLNTQLWKVSLGTGVGKPEALQLPGEEALFPDISQDRLVYAKWNRDSDIWRLQVPSAGKETSPPVKLISSTRPETDPQYSPGGDRICFVSWRSGFTEIWITAADGSKPVQLTAMQGPLLDCPRWSPDGRWIVFQAVRDGRFQAFLLNVDSREVRQLTADQKITRAAPTFSHDGGWIYFTTARTGRNEIWKMPVQGGGAVQVTRDGGLRAWESSNGLLIEKESPRGLWERPTIGGQEKLILSSHPGDPVPTDSGIWFNTPQGISFLDKAGSGLREMFVSPTSMNSTRHQMSISPDGRYLVYTQYTDNRSELILVEGVR